MHSARTRFSPGEWLVRLPWLLIWAGLGIFVALSLWLGLAGLVYPYQLDYGEGIVLWFAQQLAHGHSIYKGLTDFPYASSNYPPLSMLLVAFLMPVLREGYFAGRLLNFTATLIVTVLIYRVVADETHWGRAGLVAGLFFFGSPYVYHWIPLFRADLLGLGLTFAGVYMIWKAQRPSTAARGAMPYWLLAILCFLFALYTKQTLFAAPAAALLALWARDRRRALIFGLVLGAAGAGLYLLLDYTTGGGFTFGLLTSNATVFMPEQLVALLESFAGTFPVLLMLAGFGLVRHIRRRAISVLDWYAVTSSVALVMAGRTGAWENYFFEALLSACVLAGIVIGEWLQPRAQSALFASAHASGATFRLALALLLLAQLALMWHDHDPRIALDMMAADLPANQELASLLEKTQGVVISEDMGALATSGKEVGYYTFQYSSLARSGKWDQSWELNGLRDGLFPLVVLERGTREDVDHYRRFTREFVSALDQYYGKVQSIGKYDIYSPAPLANLQSANFGDSIGMVGWSVTPLKFSEPTIAQFTIVWQAERPMEQRYTAFVHLVDEQGGKVTQDDQEPHAGLYPTTRWAPGEMVREVYVLHFPLNPPPGKYTVRVGWYDSDTKDRLAVAASPDDSVPLMTFVIPPSN